MGGTRRHQGKRDIPTESEAVGGRREMDSFINDETNNICGGAFYTVMGYSVTVFNS